MSEVVAAPGLDRLKEIEAATKEYAEYSRESLGLAAVIGAALYAARLALIPYLGPAWDPVLSIFLMAAWPLILRRTRRWYQRAGVAVAPAVTGAWPKVNRGVTYFLVATLVLHLGYRGDHTDDAGLLVLGQLVAALLVPGLLGLASSAMRGGFDAAVLLLLVCLPELVSRAHHRHVFRGPWPIEFQALGLAMILSPALSIAVVGIHQHLAFRRLERRLQALRGEVMPGGIEP